MNTVDVLFLLKKREIISRSDDWRNDRTSRSSGLFNSALNVAKIIPNSEIIEIEDANSIDKYVYNLKPRIVIIEAFWVTPTKLSELHRLHPNVKWYIRLHSEIPFLATEGVAIGWIKSYCCINNVYVACNSKRAQKNLETITGREIKYLPNYYDLPAKTKQNNYNNQVINISCFGAIRPMKNHLLQAMAAIDFANSIGKDLHFHINSTRREDNGDPVLKNLRSLFHLSRHKLIEHPWMDHDEFLDVISEIDIGMQMSMSETFNIVSADHIKCNVPIITSNEIKITFPLFRCDDTCLKRMVFCLMTTWLFAKIKLHKLNNLWLYWSNLKAKQVWIKFIGE
jgi:hypothetical protein